MKQLYRLFVSLTLLLFAADGLKAQCDANTPSFPVNLSLNPDTTIVITSSRLGYCCGASGSSRCIVFTVKVHPGSTEFGFTVSNGNNGAYKVNCGPGIAPGTPLCLSGLTEFTVTYCNPGGNSDNYTLSASRGFTASADLILRSGSTCTGLMAVQGISKPSITWTSVAPGAQGDYNGFLNCTTGCDTTRVTPVTQAPGNPSFIDYKVCGTSIGCASGVYCDTVRVYTVPAMTLAFTPANPTICSAGGSVQLSVTPTGGNPPYTYSWTGPGGFTSNLQSPVVSTIGRYDVIVDDNTDCNPVASFITVGQSTTPTITSAATNNACSGQARLYTITADVIGTTYSWSRAAVAGISNPAVSGQTANPINEALTNTTNAAIQVTYLITPTAAGCVGSTFTYTVTVYPTPVVTNPATAPVCSGTNPSIGLTASVPSTFTWTIGTVTGGITGASAGSGSTINQILTNPSTTTAGTVQFIVTPTAVAGGCVGSPYTITVTVNPAPVMISGASATTCSGVTNPIGLTASTTSTFAWTIGNITGGITGASAGTGSTIIQTLTNPSNSNLGTVEYIITPTSSNGCVGTPMTMTVTVQPKPVLTNAAGYSICSGSSPNTVLGATTISTFAWTLGTNTGGITGGAAGSGTTLNQTLNNPSNANVGSLQYVVTPTSNYGCVGAATPILITVNPVPVVTNAPTVSVCSDNNPSIALTATAPSNFSWTVGSNFGGITGASAGTGTTINQILSNPSSTSPATLQYIVTPVSTGGNCAGSPFTITVTVHPTPIISNPDAVSICSGASTGISLSSSTASTFTWTLGTVTGGITGATAGAGPSINQALTNPSATASGSVQYIVTPTSTAGNCVGSPYTITVTVYPRPAITNNAAPSVCSGFSPNLPITSSVPSTYAWTIGTISGGITGASNGTGTILNQTLTNPSTVNSGTVEYIVTPTSTAGNCAGSPFSIIMTVFPTPVVTTAPTHSICNGATTSIALTASTPSTFTWTVAGTTGGITGASGGSGSTISQTLTNPSNATSGTVTYNVVPTSNDGCSGSTYVITVTVQPTPSITTPATSTICSGSNTNIALTATAPSNFAWTIGTITGGITGATAGSGTTINQALTNPSNATAGSVQYIVTPTSTTGACAGSPYTITVTVNPRPVMSNPSSMNLCSGGSPNLTLVATTPSTFSWTVGNITGSITGASAASGPLLNQSLFNPSSTGAGTVEYIITPTAVTGNCAGAPYTMTIVVHPIPVVTNAPGKTICNGLNTNITLTASTPSNFSWTLGTNTGGITGASAGSGPSISQALTNPSTSTAGSIQYIVTPVSTAGNCTGSPFTITVTVNPTPVVTNAPTKSICSGAQTNIALTSSAPSGFTWTLGTITGGITGATAGSGTSINQTLTNPSNSADGTVEYIVTPTSTTGSCPGAPFTITVTVHPRPVLTNAATKSICSGGNTNITLTATVPSTFTWTIGTVTGSISGASAGSGTSISQVLTNPGSVNPGTVQYIVTATSTSGVCPSTTTSSIVVTVHPTPVITTPPTSGICNNGTTAISLTSSTPSSFAWTIGTITGGITGATAGTGNSIAQTLSNPSNTTAGTVQYIVTATSTAGGCTSAAYVITVTVHPTPSVTNNAALAICSGANPNITLSATAPSNFAWTIGTVTGGITGATAGSGPVISQALTNPDNSTSGSVQYIVTPTSSTGACTGAPFTITVTVHPTPVVTNPATVAICDGSSANMTLTATTASTFSWTVGTITGNITGASAASGSFFNQSLFNPSNTTAGTVQYFITPTSVAGNCAGAPHTITVTVHPTPAVTNAPAKTICSGGNTAISLTSTTPSGFTWTIGTNTGGITGATAGTGTSINQTLTNPSSSAVGSIEYIITPTSTANACPGASYTITVTVNPRPVVTNAPAASICNGTSPNIPLTASTPSTFAWTIGTVTGGITGATAASGTTLNQTLTNPGNTTAGTVEYIITPTSTTGNCVGAPFTITVTVNPTPVVTTGNSATICNGATTAIALTASTPSAFAWTVGTITGGITGAGAGSGSTIAQTLTNPSNATSGTVQYIVTPTSTTGNCAGAPYTITVTVIPTPAMTNPAAVSICNGGNTNITLGATSPSTFAWTIGTINGGITGATAGSGPSINQTLTNPSNATAGSVQYIVTPTSTTGNCAGAPFTITVTVNPTPAVSSPNSVPTCSGTSPNIALASSAPSSFSWTIGNITGSITGASAGSGTTINQALTNPSNSASGTVEYIVTPTATTSCPGSPYTITVIVHPRPVVTNAPASSVCNGTSPNILLAASANSTFSWTVGTISGGITGATAGSGANIDQILTNPNNAVSGSVQYIVTPVSVTGNCTGAPFTITVTVHPTPAVTNAPAVSICNGGNTNIALTASAASNFSWTIGANNGGITGATAGTGTSINQVLNNPGNATAGSVQYIVTPTSTTGTCTGAPFTITVTVHPTAVVTTPPTKDICNLGSPNITLAASTPSTFSWTIGLITGSITGASAASGTLLNQTLTNPSSTTAGSVQYIVTPTSTAGNCPGTPATITINVLPTPVVTTSATAAICNGGTTNIALTASTPSSFTWTVSNVTGGITGASAGSGATIAQTLNNPGNATAGTVEYSVVPTSAGGCAGPAYKITVTVHPTPVVTNPASVAICSGGNPNISLAATTPSSFSWTIGAITGGITGATAGSGATISQTLTNPGNASAGTVQYIVTPSSTAGSCAGAPYTITVTVHPTPVVTNPSTLPICSGTSTNITLTSSAASNFTWTIGTITGSISGASAGSGAAINQVLTNPGNTAAGSVEYIITPTSNGSTNCPGVPYTITVTVNPTPAMTNAPTASTCNNTSPNIVLNATVNSTFTWTIGNITGGITGASASGGNSINQVLANPSNTTAGTVEYIVTPRSTTGNCAGAPFTITVTVNPTPGVTNPSSATICSGTSPNINLAATANSNFSWTIGAINGGITGATAGSGTTISQVLTNPSTATVGSVEYIVTPSSTTGSCGGAPFSIVVTVNPIPSMVTPPATSVCNGGNPNIQLNASTTSTFSWTIGNVTGNIGGATAGSGNTISQVLTNPSTSASGSVEYIVTPTSSAGCVGAPYTITATVTVFPTPSVTNAPTASTCSGTGPNIPLTATTPSSFIWTIGNITGGITGAVASAGNTINQTLTNPSNTTAGTVEYIVTPTSTAGGCPGAPFTITVTVNPTPAVNNNPATAICSGTSPNLPLTATAGSSFAWTIGSITGGITGASAGSGTMLNQTLTNPGNATAGTVEYIVTPTGTAGSCPGTPFTITVTVHPIPVVTNNAAVSICNGANTGITLSASANSTFAWTIGNITGSISGASAGTGGSISQALTNPSNTSAGTVEYIVTPTSVAGNCTGAPFTITVTVHPTPLVTTAPSAAICSNETTNIQLTSSTASNFAWTIGAVTGGITGATAGTGNSITQTLTNPSTTAAGTVEYIVTPTSVAGTCASATPYTITVTVNPRPVVTNGATLSICNNTSPNLQLTSSVASNFAWTIGTITGSISGASAGSGTMLNQTLTNPSNTTSGSVQYIITPTSVTGNCVSASPYTITITVHPTPAITNPATKSICSGANTAIALASTTASTFTWTIGTVTGGITGATAGAGNNISQVLTNPSSTSAGTVQYIITPSSVAANCTPSAPYTITVTVNPIPVVTNAGTKTICNGQNTNINLTSTTPATFTWTIGAINGGITGATAGSGNSISQVLTNPGNTSSGTVEYIITPTAVTGNCVNLAPYSIVVTVNPTPAVTNPSTVQMCNGGNTNIVLSASTTSTFAWTIGAITGSISGATPGSGNSINQTLTNPSNSTAGTVQYIVTPTSTGTTTCPGLPFTITVTVHPTPAVTNPATKSICHNSGTDITLNATTASSFSWTVGTVTGGITGATAGSGPAINQVLLNPSNSASGTVQYIVTPTSTAGTCAPATPFTITVTVNPRPVVNSPATSSVCSGATTNIPLSATFASNFSWTIGAINGGISGASNGSGTSINQALTNPSSSLSGSVEYIVTPVSSTGACTGAPYTITVTVLPRPVVTNTATKSICNNANTNIALTSSTSSTFSWTIGTINGSITGATAGSGTAINQVLNNPSNTMAGSVQYIVTPTSVAGCVATAPYTITVTVHPTPAVTTAPAKMICNGENTNIPLTATAASSFTWTVGTVTGGITGATGGAGNTISQVLNNSSTTAAGTVQYIVTPTSTTGSCSPATPYTITVTVNPTPVVTNPSTAFVCTGAGPNIQLTASVPSNFSWTIGAIMGGISGASNGTGSTINQPLTNPGNSASGSVQYIITPTSVTGNCTGAPYTITVTVHPRPVVTTPSTASTCSGSGPAVSLAASTSSTFTWTIGTVTGGITGASAGSGPSINQALTNPGNTSAGTVQYIVTPTAVAGNCAGSPYIITVTVYPTPTVISANSGGTCDMLEHTYDIVSGVSGATFTWSRPAVPGISNPAVTNQSGSRIQETLNNTTSSTISVPYTIIPSANGCTGTPFTYTLTVYSTPNVTSDATDSICSGEVQDYRITSAVSAATFTWDRPAVAGISNGPVTGQTRNPIDEVLYNTTNAPIVVDYIITSTATGCSPSAPFTYKVTVNPTPLVTNPNTENICNGGNPNIGLASNVASTFAWTLGAINGGITGASAGAGSTISQVLTNPGNSTSGSVQYLVTATSTGGNCAGPVYPILVNVHPTPVVTNAPLDTICSGENPNIALTASTPSNFAWTIGTVTGGITGATAGSGTTISQVLTNPGNATAGTVEYIVTPTSTTGTCAGAPFSITVRVNPTPVMTNAPADSVCNGNSPNIQLTASVPSTFTWTIGAITGSVGGASAGTGTMLNQVLTNPSNVTEGTVEYIVTPTSVGGTCAGLPYTITVTVHPTPAVTNGATKAICSGENTAITLGSTTPSSFTWTVGNITGSITGASGGAGSSISQVLTNASTTNAGSVQYIVTPTSTAGACSSASPYTITVTVNPRPVITNAATATVCSGQTTAITLASSTPSTFAWTVGTITGGITGATAGAGTAINQALTNPGNSTAGTVEYIVTPTSVTGACVSLLPYSIIVTVHPTPVITNPSTKAICSGENTDIIIASTTASTFTWTIGTITGGITGAAPGSGNSISQVLSNPGNTSAGTVEYIITPSSVAGTCGSAPYTITVTVNPRPVVTNFGTAVICSGENPNIALTSSTPSSFTWTVGTITGGITGATGGAGNSISQVLTNPGTATSGTVEYRITPTSTSGACVSLAPYNITVTVHPRPVLTTAARDTICSDDMTNIPLTATTPSTFTWVVGTNNGGITGAMPGSGNSITQTLSNPSNTNVGSIEYIVTPTSTAGGCAGTTTYTVTVYVNPKPQIVAPAPVSVCNGGDPNIQLAASIPSTFTWTIGTITGGITGASAGSGNRISQVLTNPSSASSGTVEYIVTPTSVNGCVGAPFSIIATVTVFPTPTVTNGPTATTCSGDGPNINLTASTPSTFAWTIGTVTGGVTGAAAGNGSNINQALTNPSNAVAGTVQYLITATSIAGGCPSPLDTITVTVFPRPVITSKVLDSICNNQPQTYQITSTVATGVTYNWSRPAIVGIGNAAASGTSSTITEALDNTTASPISVPYTITATANGCTGPAFTYTIKVNPTPSIISRSTDTICSGQPLNYNIVTAVSGSTLSWSRAAVPGISNPAAANVTPSITETLINTTTAPVNVVYIITPIAYGCNLVPPFAYTVTVKPTPVATAANDGPKCAGSTVMLTATSNIAGSEFNWTGPAGYGASTDTAYVTNITSANEGDYFVTAILNGCASVPVPTKVIIGNIPAVVETSDDDTLCANNNIVSLTGRVSGGTTTGIWTSSGSGVFTPSTTTLPNVTYTPSAADLVTGRVVLRLTSSNSGVCPTTFDSTIITFTPAPQVYAGEDADFCADTTIQLDGQVSGAGGAVWASTGTGVFAPATNVLGVTYIPSIAERNGGRVTLTLTSTGNGNCAAVTDTILVNIVPLPVVNAGPDVVILEGATTVLNPSVSGNDLTYLWTPNQYMNNNMLRNPVVTGINDVLYTITVRGTNGCTAKDDVLVSVLRPFKVPNTFTPNGDGINDTWVIDKLNTYPGARVQVFNRYGQVVFESLGYPQPWNGTMQGKSVPFGTYYYIIEPGSGRKPLTGYVTVLK